MGMTIELALCIAFMILALPVSKSVALHYAAFGAMNLMLIDTTIMDASVLALMFAALAVTDAVIILNGGRKILLISAIASAALCLESIMNMDWLLSRVTYLSIAVNTAIAGSLAKEFTQWMRGRYGR